jgi:bloom syndrome protein
VEFIIQKGAEEGGYDVNPAFQKVQMENLGHVVSFCENRVDCRRTLQLQYLGESFDRALCNRTCDNCRNTIPPEMRDVTADARNLLQIGMVKIRQISLNSP